MADEGLEVESTSYQRQLDEGKFRDRTPAMPPAGKSTSIFKDTAERDLQSEVYFPRPPTPPRERRFRKNLIPGEICVHWGLQEQQLPPTEFQYGIRSDKGESTMRTFKAGQKFGIEEYMEKCAESVYESNKREPLATGYKRGTVFPEEVHDPKFSFGKADKEATDGKLVIFPRGVKPDSAEVQAQYKYTHGTFKPGEMYKRNYNWPEEVSENPNFRFGKAEPASTSGAYSTGAQGALTWEKDEKGQYPKTRLGTVSMADHREVARDHISTRRNYMQGGPKFPPTHAFGKKSAGANMTAAACIQSVDSKEADLYPDVDLGLCLKKGRTNVPRQGDENRRFGCPSVRTDIVAPEKRSMADQQNYGNEAGCAAILNPQRFENMGVEDKEFLLRRPKEELRKIFCKAVPAAAADSFELYWDEALKLFNDGAQLCSLDSLLYIFGKEVEDVVEDKIRNLK